MAQTYIYLALTVVFEAFGTACIQASQQFTKAWPALGVVVGYGLAFWFLAQALKMLPLGLVYAIWSGLGIVLATTLGWVLFNQRPDLPGLVGVCLVMSGIVVMHLSRATP
jgi:small multidrug resistance pump